jgi:signal transduction histidine kinase
VITAELLTFAIWVAVFIRVLVADSLRERLFESGLFFLVLVFGILLIRSVLRLEAANEKLKQLNRMKSEFLSFASHQVKAPMAVVKGIASEIVEESYGPVSEEVKKASLQIKEMIDRMISLVENFLDWRKIEEGKMEYLWSKVELAELVQNVVEELKVITKEKGLELTLEAPQTPSQGIQIKADKQRLRQVIQNLVENAIKYTDKGFVKVKVREKENSVLVIVKDSGRGIAKEHLPHLFQQFSRVSTTAKEIKGTGLGLYIAKEIITAHKGKIWAESEGVGKGSVFYVELPEGAQCIKKNVG